MLEVLVGWGTVIMGFCLLGIIFLLKWLSEDMLGKDLFLEEGVNEK